MTSQEIEARLIRLAELGERLAARREDLAAASASDIGTPLWLGRLEVDLAADFLRSMATDVPQVAGKRPYGVVAAIFPYDAAPVMLARVGGSALLAGNRFRFSCSSQTPAMAAILREVVAPFPEITMAAGLDNRTFGQACVDDPQVRVLFISGGGEVGAVYAGQARAFDKLFFAGPSGLPPALVFKDAPLEQTAQFLVRRAFINGGQYCTCPKRVYIHQGIYDRVGQLIVTQMAEIKLGAPEDPETWIGPLRVARTRALLDRALEALKEPRFLVPYRREGEWQGPFLVETADPPDVELFGPLLALVPVATDDDVVSRALESRYPMLISFFGTPPPGAREKIDARFGMVYDNPDFLLTPLRLPFGGKGESGWILENRGGELRRRDGAFLYAGELARED